MSKAVRAGVVVVVAVLAACSSGGKQAEAPTTTSTVPPTTQVTSTTLSQEEQVKAAYLAYWQTIDRLSATPNPDDPALPNVATDPVLSSARDVLRSAAARQERTITPPNGQYNHLVRSVDVSGESASVHDCSVDDQVVLATDGQVIDGALSTKQYQATLKQIGALWKVSDVQIVEQRSGAASCAG